MKPISLSTISDYVDNIKKWAYKDVVHIQNNVLNKNPYTSEFIHNYFFDIEPKKLNKLFLFKKISIFYVKSIANFFLFLVNYVIFKLFGKKSDIDFEKEIYIIDVFFLVDNIIKEGAYRDRYFPGLYKVLKKYNKEYVFLPRLYGVDKSLFKLNKLLRVLNKDKSNKFLLEYELLSLFDILRILAFILNYPIKQFELIQQENSNLDKLFNYELFNSLPDASFEAYIRYLVGKNVSSRLPSNSKIISWQEFQNLEKAFYKAIKDSDKGIIIYGCEFLIKYDTYLSMHITDIDVDLSVTPHKTLLNGRYNYSRSAKHNFISGVSLRYKKIFKYIIDNCNSKKTLLVLLGYDVIESQKLLKITSHIENLKIKLHPNTNEKQFNKYKKESWIYTYDDLYKLFRKANIVLVPTMSGTALEAVSCGVSVIIITSNNKLNVVPMLDFGYGEIWDMASDKKELDEKVNMLLKFRKNNLVKVNSIASWYKENFFIEPTEENIVKIFEL